MAGKQMKRGAGFMHSLPDAVVLCGGAGLRLRSVTGDTPKSMVGVTGIYLVRRALALDIVPDGPVSLLRELFPRWLVEGRKVRTFSHPGVCVDIGTPKRYKTAPKILMKVDHAHSTTGQAGQA